MIGTATAGRRQSAAVALAGVLVAASAASGLIIPRFFDFAPKTQNFYALILVGLLYGLALLVDARRALFLGLLVAVGFISVTGFQYEIATGFRVSALDCLVLSFALVLFVLPRNADAQWGAGIPKVRKRLIAFLWLAPFGLLIALLRGVDIVYALAMLKAFFFPVLFLYVTPRIVRTRRQFAVVLLLAVLLAAGSAFRSRVEGPPLDQPILGRNTSSLQRSAGEWGTQNPFANYLMSAVLVPLAFALRIEQPASAVPMAVIAGVAAWGLVGTFTRGAWLGCVAAAGVLAAMLRVNKILILVIMFAVFVPLLPRAVHERAQETSDSATVKRLHWWDTGWRATLRYPVTGGGWGSGFTLVGDTLYEHPQGFPQWHNDYLAVASQTGFAGMAVFLSMWWVLVAEGFRRARSTYDPLLRPALFGLAATLVASLVHAFFDQVFWRFDSGPHNWFVVSMLVTGMHLSGQQQAGRSVT